MRCFPVITVKSSTLMALFLVLDRVEHVALLASLWLECPSFLEWRMLVSS